MSETAERAIDNRVDTLLVAAHGIAALVALLIAALFGIIVSLQFLMPDLTGGFLPLGWGRLRYAHTQGVMFGWLGNVFLAFMYHAVPVLTGQAVTSRRLGLWLFGIWNFAVMVPGWVLVLAGVSQPLEWAEFPLVVDVFVFIALGLAAAQFLPAFFRRGLETRAAARIDPARATAAKYRNAVDSMAFSMRIWVWIHRAERVSTVAQL